MNCRYKETVLDDCAVCGKKEGGFMTSTKWGVAHLVHCCSDQCGMKAKEIIEKNTASKKYKQVTQKINDLEREQSQLKFNGIKVAPPRIRGIFS